MTPENGTVVVEKCPAAAWRRSAGCNDGLCCGWGLTRCDVSRRGPRRGLLSVAMIGPAPNKPPSPTGANRHAQAEGVPSHPDIRPSQRTLTEDASPGIHPCHLTKYMRYALLPQEFIPFLSAGAGCAARSQSSSWIAVVPWNGPPLMLQASFLSFVTSKNA